MYDHPQTLHYIPTISSRLQPTIHAQHYVYVLLYTCLTRILISCISTPPPPLLPAATMTAAIHMYAMHVHMQGNQVQGGGGGVLLPPGRRWSLPVGKLC